MSRWVSRGAAAVAVQSSTRTGQGRSLRMPLLCLFRRRPLIALHPLSRPALLSSGDYTHTAQPLQKPPAPSPATHAHTRTRSAMGSRAGAGTQAQNLLPYRHRNNRWEHRASFLITLENTSRHAISIQPQSCMCVRKKHPIFISLPCKKRLAAHNAVKDNPPALYSPSHATDTS